MAIWISPYTQITFRFSGGRQPELNMAWVRVLEETANSSYGMRVMPEDAAEKYFKSKKGATPKA